MVYGSGSLGAVQQWLIQKLPPILFVRTRDLVPHWKIDTPHAVVTVGIEDEMMALAEPGLPVAPVFVKTGDLMLAWTHTDYACAVISLAS